jgi:O-acetylserine/cysteine efflux transporter
MKPIRTAMSSPLNGSRIGRTDLLIVLVIVLWAVNITVIKIGLRSLSPHGFNAIRLGLASLAYTAVLILRPGKFALAQKGDFWKAAGLGLLGITLYQVFFIKAVSMMTASTASIVMGTSPIFIALLATAVGEERISLAGWTGIAISLSGFLLVVAGENGGPVFTWEAWRGAALILLANVCWAGYTVLSKPVLARNSPLRLAAVGTIAGTVAYLPFAAGDLAGVELRHIPTQAWGAIAYSGILSIFICFVIWYKSVNEIGSAKTGVYSNLTPIIAVFFASLVLGERLAAVQVVGAAVTLAGVYLTRSGYRFFERKRGKRAAAEAGPPSD